MRQAEAVASLVLSAHGRLDQALAEDTQVTAVSLGLHLTAGAGWSGACLTARKGTRQQGRQA